MDRTSVAGQQAHPLGEGLRPLAPASEKARRLRACARSEDIHHSLTATDRTLARMPDVAGLRRLTLSDLDDDTLLELANHGEDLLVERKREPPAAPKFGAAVGSLANTLGGWMLLGVEDDGTVRGWEPPGGADVQSHLGSILRAQVDPLPPFVAAMRELDGKPLGVIRVFASSDAPHIVRGTGAVYLRSSKGKEPVDDHRTLLELARRSEESERRAAARLGEVPPGSIAALIYGDNEEQLPEIRQILRAAPLTVTPALAEWPLTRVAADECMQLAASLLPRSRIRQPSGPWPEHFGNTMIATGQIDTDWAQTVTVSTIATTDGLLGLEYLERQKDGHPAVILLESLLEQHMRPLARALGKMLDSAEAIGRVLVDYSLGLGVQGYISGGRHRPQAVRASAEVTIPATEPEIDELAANWHRQLQRQIGIVKYERDA